MGPHTMMLTRFLADWRIDILHMDQPVQYDVASMEATYNPTKVDELHGKHGLEDTQVERADSRVTRHFM